MEKQRQTSQTALDSFEHKAGELVSLMLVLSEKHMAVMPPGAEEMSPATASALTVKYALDTFIKLMRLKEA